MFPSFSPPGLAVLLAAALASGAFAQTAATDPAILRANTWDQDVIIGPGGYRGGKVHSKAKPKHVILPNAVVEKTNFTAEGNVSWKVEGALLRECRFSGDLGTYFEAKDTAFEECVLHKSGPWFSGWASTRWRLENCVFTRSFMNPQNLIRDVSVRALNCTFIGIKMPAFHLIGDNPAKGLQGKDMQFVQCRFVGCEIPESTLAMMVDCVFENCQFDNKRLDWSKAEGPVNVTAHITAGRVPPSYANGKFSVTFKQGQPPGGAVGAKLEHTLAGARIMLPWAQQIRNLQELGSINKAASEIPSFGAPGAPLPAQNTVVPVSAPATPPRQAPPPPIATASAGTPVMTSNGFFNLPESKRPVAAPLPTALPAQAPPPAASAPAAPEAREFRSLDELMRVIPMNQEFITAGRINPAALEAANMGVDQAAAGKPIALRVTVEQLVAHRADGFAFKVKSQPQALTIRGQAVTGTIEALFRPEFASALSRVGKGSVLLVRGLVAKAEFAGEKRTITFNVIIADAKL